MQSTIENNSLIIEHDGWKMRVWGEYSSGDGMLRISFAGDGTVFAEHSRWMEASEMFGVAYRHYRNFEAFIKLKYGAPKEMHKGKFHVDGIDIDKDEEMQIAIADFLTEFSGDDFDRAEWMDVMNMEGMHYSILEDFIGLL